MHEKQLTKNNKFDSFLPQNLNENQLIMNKPSTYFITSQTTFEPLHHLNIQMKTKATSPTPMSITPMRIITCSCQLHPLTTYHRFREHQDMGQHVGLWPTKKTPHFSQKQKAHPHLWAHPYLVENDLSLTAPTFRF